MRKFFLLIFFVLIFFPQAVAAADFTTGYKVEYTLSDKQNSVGARAKINITLTSLRSDIYVKKFELAFPKSFVIKNINALDNKGSVTPQIKTDSSKTSIQLEFNDPNVGKGVTNDMQVEFDQENLFKVNGNVWEVILPTIEDKTNNNYEVVVNLPPDTERKISISKPKPDEIKGNRIVWKNPTVKTIYAVFGDKQYYQTKLTYHLKNTKITPVYTDVAFPPDTLYQKIYVDSIMPSPSKVYVDEDGNFMGRYFLKPKEQLDILFSGQIELFNEPRSELQTYTRNQFSASKNYLLTQKSFWDLGSQLPANTGKTVREIYNFAVSKLTYNYQRVNKDIKRLGAKEALLTPDQAVCVEFADTFIAIAREKGIYSREIQGFGFSNDPQLRPLSLVSDVLHSWPEYYDDVKGVWVPLDPTWENTSGIDYFSSFDLNHIAFAIHGKRPDYPLPAGAYKVEDTRDVEINAVSIKPSSQVGVQMDSFSPPAQIADNRVYKTKVTIKNNSNIFLYDIPFKAESNLLAITSGSLVIPVLAPYEKREIEFSFNSRMRNKQYDANLNLYLMDNDIFSGKIVVVPYYYELAVKISVIVAGLSVVILGGLLLKKMRH